MSTFRGRTRGLAVAGLAISTLVIAGCSDGGGGTGSSDEPAASAEPVTLTWFSGSGVDANIATMNALADAFHEQNPHITIKVDASGPSGPEIDNVIKTRLATGEMPDMFWYNSGSLLQALNPDNTMLNIKGEPFLENLSDTWTTAVSTANGVFGVPVQSAGGGGILYNIPLYEELGIEVPKTWDEFLANAEVIKEAGYDAVELTLGDVWTSQIVTLADFYNVYASDPEWGTKYTQNQVNFSDDPVALKSITKLQDLYDGGYLNKDFASALLDDGLKAVATGTAANYPMLGFVQATIAQNYPDNVDDVGFFGIPGDDPEMAGMTVWAPSALYAPANTPHPDEVKQFMAFVASTDGCDTITEALGATGAYLVEGCTLPDDAPRIVADMLPYFESGATAPALEFLSPVKAPNSGSILVEVASGITTGVEGAAAYDADAAKQAQQLGLPGW